MIRLSRCRLLLGLLLILLPWWLRPAAARAQTDDDVPQVTNTFAIENARIVQAPGRVLERGTVVVRDGLVHAVGPDVAIPFDARRLAGDSLVVYAGFIDGLSHAGVPKPKGDAEERDVEEPGNPPDARAGIQPQQDVREQLDASEGSVAALRRAGFTVAHTVPYGRMLPGTGALILLTGNDPNRMVLRGEASLFAQLEPARGVYPATEMAVLARLRQLYREAERRKQIETMYAANPSGIERPPYDPVYHAFFPILDGRKPLFFQANEALEIHRILALQRALGFPLALAGLQQSFEAADALKAAGAPLFLTLRLPEEPDTKAPADTAASDTTATEEAPPPADTTALAEPTAITSDTTKTITPDPAGSFFQSDFRTRSFEDVQAETQNLEARLALEREKYYATAATLDSLGLRFGFATMGARPQDLHDNLRRMVAHGLSEETALAALTTHPAAFLGLSQSLGTVEPGKIANLVVTSAPLFTEESTIRYVFVDGQPFEIEAEGDAPAGEGEEGAVNPVGTWSYAIETPGGTQGGTLTLTGSPGALSGTIASPDGEEATLEDVELDGATLSFSFDGGPYGRLTVVATVEGDELDGSVTVPGQGGVRLTGTRTPGKG